MHRIRLLLVVVSCIVLVYGSSPEEESWRATVRSWRVAVTKTDSLWFEPNLKEWSADRNTTCACVCPSSVWPPNKELLALVPEWSAPELDQGVNLLAWIPGAHLQPTFGRLGASAPRQDYFLQLALWIRYPLLVHTDSLFTLWTTASDMAAELSWVPAMARRFSKLIQQLTCDDPHTLLQCQQVFCV